MDNGMPRGMKWNGTFLINDSLQKSLFRLSSEMRDDNQNQKLSEPNQRKREA